MGRPDQEGLLPDGEARFRMDADEARLERPEDVPVAAAQIRERRPPLPLSADGLTLVLADGATHRRSHGRGGLDAAAQADTIDHTVLRSSRLWTRCGGADAG